MNKINQIKSSDSTFLYQIQDYDFAYNPIFTIQQGLQTVGGEAGSGSISIGPASIATGEEGSFALGNATARGSLSFALGRNVSANGSHSFVFGDNVEVSRPYSVAFGEGLNIFSNKNSSSTPQLVIGKYNHDSDLSVFVIGNGQNNENRHNLFSIDTNKIDFNDWFNISTIPKAENTFYYKIQSDGHINFSTDNASAKMDIDLNQVVLNYGINNTQVTGKKEPTNSISFGSYNSFYGDNSFSFGRGLKAGDNQFAIGQYNVGYQNSIFEIGNGSDENSRSTILSISANKELFFGGTIQSESPPLSSCGLRNIYVDTKAPDVTDGKIGDIYLWYDDSKGE